MAVAESDLFTRLYLMGALAKLFVHDDGRGISWKRLDAHIAALAHADSEMKCAGPREQEAEVRSHDGFSVGGEVVMGLNGSAVEADEVFFTVVAAGNADT